MSTAVLRAVVEHDVRLEVLRCLDGAELTLADISVRVTKSRTEAAYHVNVLEARSLVRRFAGGGTGDDADVLYTAALDDQPEWVRAIVRGERLRRTDG